MKSILLIDDDPTSHLINKFSLKKLNPEIEVNEFLSGQEAMDYLGSCSIFPDYILLDINMPDMDGWEFLDAYKALGWDKEKSTKVAMVSTSDNLADIRKSESYTPLVFTYLEKPLLADTLKKEFPEL